MINYILKIAVMLLMSSKPRGCCPPGSLSGSDIIHHIMTLLLFLHCVFVESRLWNTCLSKTDKSFLCICSSFCCYWFTVQWRCTRFTRSDSIAYFWEASCIVYWTSFLSLFCDLRLTFSLCYRKLLRLLSEYLPVCVFHFKSELALFTIFLILVVPYVALSFVVCQVVLKCIPLWCHWQLLGE